MIYFNQSLFGQNYNVKNRTTIVMVLNVFKITQKWGHEECAGSDELQVAYTCNL